MATIKFCKHCGKEISPDASFCSYCGKPIDAMPAVDEVEEGAHFDGIEGSDNWNNYGPNSLRETHSNKTADEIKYSQIVCYNRDGLVCDIWMARKQYGNLEKIWFLSNDKTTRLCSDLIVHRADIHYNTVLCWDISDNPFILVLRGNTVLRSKREIYRSIRYGNSLADLFPGQDTQFMYEPVSLNGYYLNFKEVICIDNFHEHGFYEKTEHKWSAGALVAIGVFIMIFVFGISAMYLKNTTWFTIVVAAIGLLLWYLGDLIYDNSSYTIVSFSY